MQGQSNSEIFHCVNISHLSIIKQQMDMGHFLFHTRLTLGREDDNSFCQKGWTVLERKKVLRF